MSWPRGKYNGARITGASVKFKIDITTWRWIPLRVKYVGGLHWLCFYSWWEWEYDTWERRWFRENVEAEL